MSVDKFTLFWIITLSMLCTLLWATLPNHYLAFDRNLINQGEWWRIITGNLVHTNLWHLLLNLSGLILLGTFFQRYLSAARLPILLFLLWVAVGLGIWLFLPSTQWYMGLSGSLYGLLVWGGVQEITHQQRTTGIVILLATAGKIAMDSYLGADSGTASLIAANVHLGSHLIGATTGLLLASLCVIRVSVMLTVR